MAISATRVTVSDLDLFCDLHGVIDFDSLGIELYSPALCVPHGLAGRIDSQVFRQARRSGSLRRETPCPIRARL